MSWLSNMIYVKVSRDDERWPPSHPAVFVIEDDFHWVILEEEDTPENRLILKLKYPVLDMYNLDEYFNFAKIVAKKNNLDFLVYHSLLAKGLGRLGLKL